MGVKALKLSGGALVVAALAVVGTVVYLRANYHLIAKTS